MSSKPKAHQEPDLSQEAETALNQLLQFKAGILKDRERERILSVVSLLTKATGLKTAERQTVLEAARLVLPDTYEMVLTAVEDPKTYQQEWREPLVNQEAYLRRGIRLERWQPVQAERNKPVSEMKALALCASPRKKGNTQRLLEHALAGVESGGVQTELINIARSRLQYCNDCNQCLEKPPQQLCVLNDDMTHVVLPRLLAADIVILGFPIYCARESAQLATFFDRWHCLVGKGLLRGKSGMLVCTWGHPSLTNYRSVMERIIDHMEHFGIRMLEAIAVTCLMGVLLGYDENKNALVSRYPKELKTVFEAGAALVGEPEPSVET